MIKNSGKRKLSIKQEVFYLGVVFSLVTLLLFGGILCTSIYYMQVNHAKQALHDSNYHMAMIAKNQSRAISNTLQVLSNNPDVRTAGLSDDEALVSKVRSLYRDYYNSDKNIMYIYSGYENGRIIIDNWTSPPEFDPRERPWYKHATDIKENKVVLGRAYQDASTKQWLVSSSTPLYGMDGEFVGVLSIDRTVENMSNIINEKNLYKSQYSFIYADINGLKLANDLKGHATGDKLIKLAATSIKKELRTNDIFSRIGGDEFGIVLPQTGAEAAGLLIERIRASLEDKKVEGISLSISFGYATKYKPEEKISSIITDSDSNMYSNKITESAIFKKNTIIDFRNALENKHSMTLEDKLRTKKICDVAMIEMGIKGDE